MANHSRALANILFKNAPKKGVKKTEVKKEPSKPNNKK
jgi:hypothetical protein